MMNCANLHCVIHYKGNYETQFVLFVVASKACPFLILVMLLDSHLFSG